MKKKRNQIPPSENQEGGERQRSFLPFDVFLQLDVSPRDSFKGITPLAFPRQPRRRDWHSRRVLDPLADRRDTSTPRHLDSQHSSRETVDNGWPQRFPYTFSSKYLSPIARNDTLFTVIIFPIVVVISYNFKGGSFQSLSEKI